MDSRKHISLSLVSLTVFLLGAVLGSVVAKVRISLPSAHAQEVQTQSLLLAGGVGTSSPQLVNFQGFLRSPTTGSPLADGTYQLTFSLYQAGAGGTALWSEVQSISVSRGVFRALLGSDTPLPVERLNTPELWLGIKVGNPPELTPRLRVGSSFYSRTSEQASSATKTGISAKRVAEQQWYTANKLGGPSFPLSGGPVVALMFDDVVFAATPQGVNFPNGFNNSSEWAGCNALASDGRTSGFGSSSFLQGLWCAKQSEIRSLQGLTALGWNPLSCTDCRRMVFDGQHLWATSFGPNQLLKIDISNRKAPSLIATYSMGSHPLGVAFDGEHLWIVRSGDNTLARVLPTTGQVLQTLATGQAPSDVLFDGENLWVVNTGGDSVSKYRASDGAPRGTFTVGKNPNGIASDGTVIWVLNVNDKTVTKLRASDGATLSTFAAVIDGVQGQAVAGIAADGEGVWVGVQEAVGEQSWMFVRY